MDEVRWDDDTGQYQLVHDGHLVGRADAARRGDVTVLPHTVIDPAWRGQGLGDVLVAGALADLRRRGQRVVPRCWFVADYLERHPEDADLLAS